MAKNKTSILIPASKVVIYNAETNKSREIPNKKTNFVTWCTKYEQDDYVKITEDELVNAVHDSCYNEEMTSKLAKDLVSTLLREGNEHIIDAVVDTTLRAMIELSEGSTAMLFKTAKAQWNEMY